MPRAQIKDEKAYQELRGQGESKEKSARIANWHIEPAIAQWQELKKVRLAVFRGFVAGQDRLQRAVRRRRAARAPADCGKAAAPAQAGQRGPLCRAMSQSELEA